MLLNAQALSEHAGWRAAMEFGSMTEEMAKRYMLEIRGSVKTTTRKAIEALEVGDDAAMWLGNRSLLGDTSCAEPRHRWGHHGTRTSQIISPLCLQVCGGM